MISVIIPVYNAVPYIGECLDSLAAQTYADLEIIAVDDGSTDGSREIVERRAAADRRIRLFCQPNSGQSAARNVALDNVHGDYVCFVDADDLLHPQALEMLLDLCRRHGADISMGDIARGDRPRWRMSGDERLYTVEQAVEDTLYQHRLNNSMSGKLFAAHLLDGLRMRENLWYEDLDFFYRVYERSTRPIAVTGSTVYFYRNTPGSFINVFNDKRLDVLRVTADIEAHYSGNRRLLRAARDRRFSANCNMYILASQAGMDDVAARCWQLIRRYRGSSLTNRRVRLKNRLGALVSYLGPPVFRLLGHLGS